MKYITTIDGKDYEIELLEDRQVSVDGKVYQVDFAEVPGQRIYTLLIDGRSFEAHVELDEDEWHVMMQGTKYVADVVDEREKRLREAGGATSKANGIYLLKSPMPGLVVSIPVSVGDTVAEGDVLIILESMKMQNELKSPQDGIISEIEIQPGDSVEQRQRMLTITPPPDQEDK